MLVGEAKWSRKANGAVLRAELEQKSKTLPRLRPAHTYAVCAREQVNNPENVLAITAADIFEPA